MICRIKRLVARQGLMSPRKTMVLERPAHHWEQSVGFTYFNEKTHYLCLDSTRQKDK